MINAAYTLLMNVDGALPPDTSVPGAELIDPTYRTVNLPAALDTIRTVLFGTDPDRHMLTYRTRQLLTVLHATPLETHITAIDPRITYKFADANLHDAALFRPVVTVVSDALARLSVIGTPTAPDASGRSRHVFLVETTDTDTVRIGRRTKPISNLAFDFTPGSSVVLIGSGYSAKLASSGYGQKWLVEVTNRPQRTLGEIVTHLGQVGEPTLLTLFGVTTEEPYRTFRNLWARTTDTPLRLSAVVAALVYRTEERRRRGV